MKPPKVGASEALLAHDGHRKRIAKGTGHGRRGRGSDGLRPYFGPMRKYQGRGRRLGKGRPAVARDCDDRNVSTLEMVNDRLELCRFAALGDENCDITFRRHAQVAVNGLREVKKHRGRAGRTGPPTRDRLARHLAP